MNYRRILGGMALVFLVIVAGCGGGQKSTVVEGKVNVMTSFYPLYDFAVHIGGAHVNVVNLVPAGVEPHDWTPKGRDIMNVGDSELFLYQGAGFEGWVDDFMKSVKDKKVKAVEASAGAHLLEAAEGGDGHDHQHGEESRGSSPGDLKNTDPHAWLSPHNAKKMSENIKNALIEVDPAHREDYENNYKAYAAKLDGLDKLYHDSLKDLPKKEIAVSHQAFAYLCHDYGLTQMAIMGLSPDSEPTAQDMKKMREYIQEHQLKYVFFEELVSDKLAKTLAKDAGVETLVLNPLEGLTEEQIKEGQNYISVMENNLKNLVKALQ
ncbi:metal ABC transporter substrate-binding protein [Paenibacillus sp. FJAT-26967]|uniref:metal ABC transporter substrate-binding protein n=1 Tax=Paenibacillus sp. FJAT-26967 TaxID=1729690 RepID=UPI000839223D|nr:metal ABC transporter substrate-binding protein [Paenibacillus sp. FJAT-26967]